MSDIVERLRLDSEPTESDMEEAAAEIERLRARVEEMEMQRPWRVLGVEPFFDGGHWCVVHRGLIRSAPTREEALTLFDRAVLAYARKRCRGEP